MKKDELLERAINYYRHGYKVAEIARICNVSRMTIHRWVKDTGARRDDYIEISCGSRKHVFNTRFIRHEELGIVRVRDRGRR